MGGVKEFGELGACSSGSFNILKEGPKFRTKADFTKSEPKQLTDWEKHRTLCLIRESRRGCSKFILHDGPPYANGKAHAGHAVNKILKDVIIKHKILSGFDAPLILGWDCHGLPIENQIKEEAPTQTSKSKLQLIKKARAFAMEQVESQYDELRRLGLLIKRDEAFLTMHGPSEAEEIRLFRTLLSKGWVSRNNKPLPWCFNCKTNLADVEVKNQLQKKAGAYITFPFFRSKRNYEMVWRLLQIALSKATEGLGIWTTNPWTLIANSAISINPNLNYVLVRMEDGITTACTEMAVEHYIREVRKDGVVIRITKGIKLFHLKFQHPFSTLLTKYCQPLKPMLDPTIRTSGTGAVHIAPVHSPDDFRLWQTKAKGVPKNSVSRTGLHKSILLRRRGIGVSGLVTFSWVNFTRNLGGCVPSSITVMKCGKHQTDTIFRSLRQWFVSTALMPTHQADKAGMLKCLRDTNFIPENSRQHLTKVITDRPDWCLSRQKSWGVPIPLLEHRKNRNLHPFTSNIIEALTEEIVMSGIEVWVGANLLNFKRKRSVEYKKSDDTLDVWFDSGTAWNVLRKHPTLSFPADLCLEGADQYRGWFYSSLVTSVMLNGISPTRAFVTHGFVVNSRGEKLSKSAGNASSLSILLEKEGAEVLRLLVVSLDYQKDMKLTPKCFGCASDSYKKIRSTIKFLLTNLSDFMIENCCTPTEKANGIDAFLLSQTKKIKAEFQRHFNSLNFREAVRVLIQFCADELGRFYLEIVKDRLYLRTKKNLGRVSAQSSLYYATNFLLKSITPVLPFTSEEAWGLFQPTKGSVLRERYQALPSFCFDPKLCWEILRLLREEATKTIGKMLERRLVNNSFDVQAKLFCFGAVTYLRLQVLGSELRRLLSISKGRLVFGAETKSVIVRLQNPNYNRCWRCWVRTAVCCYCILRPICLECKWLLQQRREESRLF
ncbi:isoleucyl-tRNA synthetase [Candidatus Tremblaya phenacola PAVE]|nr:isoleucyl-tRNA synthetase [Candidatus Tremblaya phenacola PAVE]